MNGGAMAFGAFMLALGFALMVGGPSLVSLWVESAPFSASTTAAADDGMLLVILGMLLAPIGAAVLSLGISSGQRQSPQP